MPKRKTLTLREKIQIIQMSEGKSHRTLADQFQISKTQITGILKRKVELLGAYESDANPDRKRQCQNTGYAQIDAIVFEWFSRMRSLSIPVSGPMIQTKALDIAKALNQPNFKASGGWLSRFKSRHIIGCNRISGEKSTVSQETIDNWHERLQTILEGYQPRDIFNMDETGLYYRALPDKTLAVKGTDVSGGKKSKERLTASLCVNQLGEFEKTLVIGKSLHPRCFRNLDIRRLPVIWRANKKAWMNTALFEEWVRDFNCRMLSQGRHVILLLDNAPSHPHELQLSSTKLVYLPANATSCLQPLDQGIIQAMKLQYRRRLLQHVITKADNNPDPQAICKSIDVHLAVTWLHAAIRDIKASTVQKCFYRTGITTATPVDLTDDEDDIPLAELLRQTTTALKLVEPMSTEEYIAMDDSCPSHDSLDDGWEVRLIQEATTAPDESELASDDETEVTPDKQITDGEALDMLATLRDHFLKKNYCQTVDLLMATQQQFEEEKIAKCTSQPTIDSFIKRV